MPRAAVDIGEHKEAIRGLIIDESYTDDEILAWLQQRGFQLSRRTLTRRLADWGPEFRRQTTQETTEELRDRISELHHYTLLDDSEIATQLGERFGLHPTKNQVRDIRLQNGWLSKVSSNTQSQDQGHDEPNSRSGVTQQLLRDMVEGPGRSYGYRWAQTYLRTELGHRASQHEIRNTLKTIDPEGVDARRLYQRKPRVENYLSQGPDYMWSSDGHDKFRKYGIQIYSAVDCYSRRILWFYCGNSNRTQHSVLKQYLEAVREYGICPDFIRTDRGTEVDLMAGAHLSLFIESATRQGWTEADNGPIQLEDCFIFGKSTSNTRIEGLWNWQRRQQTDPWLGFFDFLSQQDLFRPNSLADEIGLLFVFMPILREELRQFVRLWNSHHIRKQSKRTHHVAGAPNELYEQTNLQCGFTPNIRVLQSLEARLPQEHGYPFLLSFSLETR
jgi:hypothetical protein